MLAPSVEALPAPPGWADRQPLSRRAIALAIVILVHLLLVAVLILLAPPLPGGKSEPAAFELLPDSAPPAEKKAAAKTAKKASKAPPRTAITPPMAVTPVEPQPKLFEKQLFDAVDISKRPTARDEIAATDSGGAPGDTPGVPGAGPGGATLYKAEWQREPTDTELSFYMPKTGVPKGAWGAIVCRTAPRFRVEDCQLLGESPRGSSIARGVSEAAWQFRVRPPRRDGKMLIGAWVSIRIDFGRREGADGDAPADEGTSFAPARPSNPGTYGPPQ
jgi:protein TonB